MLTRRFNILCGAILSVWSPAALGEEPSAYIVSLVSRVIPAVVSIETLRFARGTLSRNGKTTRVPDVVRAEGSGFIVDSSGHIATNRHVIEGAYAVNVTLSDGRDVAAKVIWKSSNVDVAFLKIDVGHPLPTVTIAGNQHLQLGQRVVAIGNPFGLGISVSAGIVSALDRNLKQSPYDDFIQTDAAINHGSSGGPLFDEAGEVIGMNSALYASVINGGSEGVGFAIPGSDIAFLIEQLKRDGHIRCGWLGVSSQKVTPAVADALGFPTPYGVIVASIDRKSPALKAGLRRGDIIQSLNGKVLYDFTTFNRGLCEAPAATVAMKVWRSGHFISLTSSIIESGTEDLGLTDNNSNVSPRFASARDLGMSLEPLSNKLCHRYHLAINLKGLVVTAVSTSSVADDVRLHPGDVLTSLQMTPLSNDKAFDKKLVENGLKGRHHVIVMVQSRGGERLITFPVRLSPIKKTP